MPPVPPVPHVPFIAVIIPTFNRRRRVLEALASVAAQSRPADLVIVIDDGSADDTSDAIRAWQREQPPPFDLQLITQPNAGPAAARQRGLDAASSADLLFFLDSDDLWPPTHIARLTDALTAKPRAVAATADLLEISGSRRRLHTYSRLNGHATLSLFIEGPAPLSSTAVRRAPALQAGGFHLDDRGFEDWNFDLRLSLRGPWAHVTGDPAIRRCDPSTSPASGGQLTREFTQPLYLWREWRMMRRFLRLEGGAAHIPRPLQRRRLARQVYRLGRALAAAQRFDAAATCFRRALRIDPHLFRARRRLLWLKLTRRA